jgi:hypothetical protein
MIPDCTLTTSCFNLTKYHKGSRTLEDCINNMKSLLEVQCYLVIFTDNICVDLIKKIRNSFNLDNITHYIVTDFEDIKYYKYNDTIKSNRDIYWPTKDERTSSESHLLVCNKFDFVLKTIEMNPFNTTKFGWIDSSLGPKSMRICENYSVDKFLNVLNNISEKFHIQILNVNDKKYKLDEYKKEYYNTYRYVVCGGFFTCGSIIGLQILSRLNDIFIKTTELGYGHGEEMLYLDVLDDFYDDIVKSYGDYGQIINNYINPTCNLNYIYNNIIKSYLNFGYNKECYDCCKKVLYSIENLNVSCEPSIYIQILFSYYVSSFYHKQNESVKIVNHIYDVCNNNSIVKSEFDKNKRFYESQFNFCNVLKPKYKIIINIFGCATVEKYRKEIIKINETWGKKAEENGIKILFFLGEEKSDLIDENKYIYLKDVKNDYNSASYKQNLGLKYIYENYNADFVFTCGTDTYINIDNLLLYISQFDKNTKLYIGGHGEYRMVGDDNIYFHSGGAGFILSNSVLSELYSQLYNIQNEWTTVCSKNYVEYLIKACDVLIGYYVSKIVNIVIIKNNNFYSCNYKGYANSNTFKCCGENVNIYEIISCHFMTLTDFDEYTNIINLDTLKDVKSKNNIYLIKNKYNYLSNIPSDINEHLPKLYNYATKCESIIELGVRGCVSSWALTYGLLNNNKSNKVLFLNDLEKCNIDELLYITKEVDIKINYEWISDLKLETRQNYDLTFIDTWHVYGQLKRELEKYSKITNKYIIMHDTTVDEVFGETIRCGLNAEEQSKISGFPIEEINRGLWPAVEEFLQNNKNWIIKERYTNNNGLTILERVN